MLASKIDGSTSYLIQAHSEEDGMVQKEFFIENVTVLNQSTIKVIDEIFHDKSNLCVNRICGSESDDYDHFLCEEVWWQYDKVPKLF